MKHADLITEDNWETVLHRFQFNGPMKTVLVNRYYIVNMTKWYTPWKRKYALVAEPAFIGEVAILSDGTSVRRSELLEGGEENGKGN